MEQNHDMQISALSTHSDQYQSPQPGAAPSQRLPFELLLAVCAQLPQCACYSAAGARKFGSGCEAGHPPGAFGRTELSTLRQTSRAWRAAALRAGVAEIVVSSRWMGGGRLQALHAAHGAWVRRVAFRMADVRGGDACAQLEAALALGWARLDAVAVEWFSGRAEDHARIAAAVRRHASRVREVSLHDKNAVLGAQAWPAGVTRLGLRPFGYSQHWAALRPAERGGAEAVRRMRLTALATGGADVTPQLMAALHTTQPRLALLTVEHAWLDALATNFCLPRLTRLVLENVAVPPGSVKLPVSARMFPALRELSVRHVWRHAGAASARGAELLQDATWLRAMWADPWPRLRVLALPALADTDAALLPHACPVLERLVTHSLDYAGPPLSAAGLVALLRALPRLRYLSIEQRRADGTPGYRILPAALGRLLGDSDDDDAFGRRVLAKRASTASTLVSPGISPISEPDADVDADTDVASDIASVDSVPLEPTPDVVDSFFSSSTSAPLLSTELTTLVLPRAAFTAAMIDSLVRQLPSLARLSVALRGDAFPTPAKGADPLAWHHSALRWLGLTADEDTLADAQHMAAWLRRRFPALEECSTSLGRAHRRAVAELRDAAPAVRFTRLSSRALQAATPCN
ncbi:hypothetical protein H4R20_005065 [Coemansia guatemalensis]|uniref:Uncharacterized protein n=1 Tax=Coemansia guatemalensis TaxID=2761395 RepID=A0A9W8HWD1_9FUNG|nr:hypothetical protein H4R20_005065 [Coemansia guatemalensis]